MNLQIVLPMLNYYPDRPSGSTRLAFDEAVFLAERGHKVWVVTQDLSRTKPEYTVDQGLHVLRYPSPQLALLDPRRMRVHQKCTVELVSRYIEEDSIDLIHGHSLLHYDGLLSFSERDTTMCYSVHSPVLHEMRAAQSGASVLSRLHLILTGYLSHRIERRCLQRSTCITADSEYSKLVMGQLHGKDIQQRVRVISGWVDLERFQIISDRQSAKSRLGWPTDVPVFFTLRRLVPRMGLERLIRALAIVRRAGQRFQMIIGGRGPLKARLAALIRELEMEDFIQLLGFVPEDQVPLMYAAADAFVLPTKELECFGLIALESLACGRPVLATPVGAIPEILNRVEPRWLAQDNSIDAIAQLLVHFLQDRLPFHSPESLRQTMQQYYSQETMLEQMYNFVTGGSET